MTWKNGFDTFENETSTFGSMVVIPGMNIFFKINPTFVYSPDTSSKIRGFDSEVNLLSYCVVIIRLLLSRKWILSKCDVISSLGIWFFKKAIKTTCETTTFGIRILTIYLQLVNFQFLKIHKLWIRRELDVELTHTNSLDGGCVSHNPLRRWIEEIRWR